MRLGPGYTMDTNRRELIAHAGPVELSNYASHLPYIADNSD